MKNSGTCFNVALQLGGGVVEEGNQYFHPFTRSLIERWKQGDSIEYDLAKEEECGSEAMYAYLLAALGLSVRPSTFITHLILYSVTRLNFTLEMEILKTPLFAAGPPFLHDLSFTQDLNGIYLEHQLGIYKHVSYKWAIWIYLMKMKGALHKWAIWIYLF
ncbi:hypothetical protein ACJX0J_027273 [Zea mays]